ncbi:MAG: signal peptidase I, partial [Oscillospiraceae bacterium]
VSFVVVFVIFHFVIQMVNVEGVSMQPTLQQNDRLVISKLFYHPASGDIVVLSDKTGLKKPLIKRIIAVEGQQLDIGEDGVVSVDGVPLEESYIQETIQKTMRGDHVYPVTIPQDHVFVMGDNRNNSTDSRFEELFFVNEKEILGRVLLRIYPLNKFGTINE